MWEKTDTLSLILGILITILGLVPLLNQMGVIAFALPGILNNEILIWVAALAGLYTGYIGFTEEDSVMKWPTRIVGGLVFILGLVSILGSFDLIAFAGQQGFQILLNSLYVLMGLLLLWSLFTYRSDLFGI